MRRRKIKYIIRENNNQFKWVVRFFNDTKDTYVSKKTFNSEQEAELDAIGKIGRIAKRLKRHGKM